jgi:hypothetical protein
LVQETRLDLRNYGLPRKPCPVMALPTQRKEGSPMSIDDLFEGELVTTIPSPAQLGADKMPGDGDGEDKGDHCSFQL